MWEVIAVGFDGSTDETDDRVLWVEAEQLDLTLLLLAVPHQGCFALPHTAAEVANAGLDFVLPRDADRLIKTLKRFAETLP